MLSRKWRHADWYNFIFFSEKAADSVYHEEGGISCLLMVSKFPLVYTMYMPQEGILHKLLYFP